MPVSVTEKRIWLFEPSSGSTRTTTSPADVNFTALVSKLRSTCRKRVGSPATHDGNSESTKQLSSSPLRCAGSAIKAAVSSASARGSKSTTSSASLPASILEKSRISLITVRSASPEWRMASA